MRRRCGAPWSQSTAERKTCFPRWPATKGRWSTMGSGPSACRSKTWTASLRCRVCSSRADEGGEESGSKCATCAGVWRTVRGVHLQPNQAREPTRNSLRSSVAPAIGCGSPLALGASALSQSKRKELQMTDEIAAANKGLVRRFYAEVYVDWNMALVDEVYHLSSHLTIGHKAAQPVRRRSGIIMQPYGP